MTDVSADCATGARRKCEELDIKLLGDVPLHARICSDADAGRPTVVADAQGPQACAFGSIVDQVLAALRLR